MRKKTQIGFTVVELLIVIVVIAVLAGIITAGYNGVQQRAKTTTLKTDLSAAAKDMLVTYAATGEFPTVADNLPASGGTTYELTADNSSLPTFCLTGTNGDVSYMVTDEDSAPVEGICDGHTGAGSGGGGGVGPTIVNLIPNPSFEVNYSGWSSSRASRDVVAGAGQAGGDILRVTVNSVGWFPRAFLSGGEEAQVEAGKTYRLSAWIKSSLPTIISLEPVGGDTSPTNQTFNTNNQWTYASLTIDITDPADTAMSVWIGFPNNTALNETLDIDEVMLTEGTDQYSYADGDSPGWSWSGTPHLSPSSGPAL